MTASGSCSSSTQRNWEHSREKGNRKTCTGKYLDFLDKPTSGPMLGEKRGPASRGGCAALAASSEKDTTTGRMSADRLRAWRHSSIEAAQDEVELYQAQLAVKRAQLDVVRVALEAGKKKHKRIETLKDRGAIDSQVFAESELEVARLHAELQVKQAELKEPEIRMKQAQRCLNRLKEQEQRSSPGRPTKTPSSRAGNPLEALQREVDVLRKARETRPRRSGVEALYQRGI